MYKPGTINGKNPNGPLTKVLTPSISNTIPVKMEIILKINNTPAGMKINAFKCFIKAYVTKAIMNGTALYLIDMSTFLAITLSAVGVM